MLSLQEINARPSPCRGCDGRFRVALPHDWETSETLATLVRRDSIGFIKTVRTLTGCSLRDAKGTMQHFTLKNGACHRCERPIAADEAVAECRHCGSLNLQFVGV